MQQRIDDLERRPVPLPCGLPQLTKDALEQVRKWDADASMDEQRKLISTLRRYVNDIAQENASLTDELDAAQDAIERLSHGHDLTMIDLWKGMFSVYGYDETRYRPWHSSTRSLHDFLWHLTWTEGGAWYAGDVQRPTPR